MTARSPDETLTIAEIQRTGYDGLRITFPGCGWIVITWSKFLRARPGDTLETVRRRMRCQRCDTGPGRGHVVLYCQGDEAPVSLANHLGG